jgi:hypothetical protein
MRLRPKIANGIASLVSFNAILRHPRAKIIASRLQYTPVLLRLITSDKSGRRYPRVSSLNNDSDTGNASPYKDNATPDAGNAHHWQAGRDTGKA